MLKKTLLNKASNPTLELAQKLISLPSITPLDSGCQNLLIERLISLGFVIEKLPFEQVSNFYAKKGRGGPVLLFAGHTDVVPPGPLQQWTSPPFEPTIRDGKLYGRGAADMKSSLAAMICACEQFIKDYPDHKGAIAFLITSDEEGDAINGTKRVVELLSARKEHIDWCIVGEASSETYFGDVVKIGRRGSLSGKLIIHGQQGHIAYPQKASNPIHKSLLALDELSKTKWDEGNDDFPPTSFQISNIHAGTGANNVIPADLEVVFNFRYNTCVTHDELQQQLQSILDNHQLQYHVDWHLSGEPFLSQSGSLLEATTQALRQVVNRAPRPSTEGGTSDGRFIIKLGCEILELGPINHSIHQIDENIGVEELQWLTQTYYEILVRLLG